MSLVATVRSGSLVPREYADFRGVDFSNKEVNLSRSPNSLNMWKDYKELAKCIETRPSEELYLTTDNTVYGMYFYKISSRLIPVFHIGTKLYTYENNTLTQIHSGMNPKASRFFVYRNILFIMDGLNYLEYNGTTVSEVEGTIPKVFTATRFETGNGTNYQDKNLLSDYITIGGYTDGEITDLYLQTTIDANNIPKVDLLDEQRSLEPTTDYTWSNEYDANGTLRGVIHLNEAIPVPLTDGQDNIEITIKHHKSGDREKVTHCLISQEFDNSIFVSGNVDYPTEVFFSALNDARYFPDTNHRNEGLDSEPIKSMVAGNGALWVVKSSNGSNDTVFYHLPIDEVDDNNITHRRYSTSSSNIAIGCNATGINFNDDIVFFSNRGMEAINSANMDSEQILAHRSSMVDSKMLSETDYNKMKLIEWEGYLLSIIGNKVYLADSRAMFTFENHNEYEWFYWELTNSVKSVCVYEGKLYLGTATGIYTLTDTSSTRTITSYWTTPEDEFKAPQYQKTTNKKGCIAVKKGGKIKVSAKTDNNSWQDINEYETTKDYIVARIKKKKWRTLQLKYSSTKPFGLYSATVEAYVGAYVKR